MRLLLLITLVLTNSIIISQQFDVGGIIYEGNVKKVHLSDIDMDGACEINIVSGRDLLNYRFYGIESFLEVNSQEDLFNCTIIPDFYDSFCDVPTSTQFTDIDGDGDLDILFERSVVMNQPMSYSKSIKLKLNQGNGQFSSSTGLAGFSSSSVDYDVYALPADINNDGLMDVALFYSEYCSYIYRFNVKIMINEGNNTFTSSEIYTVNSNCNGVNRFISQPMIEDIYGSDIKELILNLSDFDDNFNFTAFNFQNNSITESFGSLVSDGNANASSANFIDFTQNGNLEFLYCKNGTLYIHPNWNSPTIEVTPQFQVSKYLVKDFDQDNDLDIVIASNDSIGWLENLGEYSFIEHFILPLNENSISGGRLLSEDIDNDGDDDIVLFNNSQVFWIKNKQGEGCMDNSACNYDYTALIEDNTCCFGICGCSDIFASNYVPESDCETECLFIPGDFNGDNIVNSSDLANLLSSFGETCDFIQFCPGDYNQDGAITMIDLSAFLSAFGQ